MPALDITKSSIEILIDKINIKNATSLNSTDFIFGVPTVYNQPGKTENTSVTLSAKQNTDFYGNVVFYYQRMDLGVILDNPNINIVPATETTLYQLLAKINYFYGINLTQDDVIDQTFQQYDPQNPNQEISVVVMAKDTSYLFRGSFRLRLGLVTPVVPDLGVIRTHYVLINGLNAVSGILSNIKSIANEGTINLNFNLLQNATSVTHFEVRKMYTTTNERLVLDGEFTFTASIAGGASTAYVSKKLILDKNGVILAQSNVKPFGGDNAATVAHNRLQDNRYVVDAGSSLGSSPVKLYKYDTEGVIISGYNAVGVGNIPTTIALADNGKLYTASDIITAAVPTNNNIPGKQIRIDRLLSDGTVDSAFTPVIITAPGSTDPLRAVQILPVNGDGFWLLLNPVGGVATTANLPIINGVPTIASVGALEHSFNPIYRFTEAGVWRTTFNNNLLTYLSAAIYSTSGSNMTVANKVLNYTSDGITWLTNKVNPITGYTQRLPITFDIFGKKKNISGDAYEASWRWTNAKHIVSLLNGKFLSYGGVNLRTAGGDWDTLKQIVGRYKVTGENDVILYNHVPIGTGTETIDQVAVVEVLVA